MREEQAAAGLKDAFVAGQGGREGHRQGETGQGMVSRVAARERDQGRVGVNHHMTQGARYVQAGAVAAGRRHRETTGGEDHPAGGDRIAPGQLHPPDIALDQAGHARPQPLLHAAPVSCSEQGVEHVARPIAFRKQLARFGLQPQRHGQVLVKEAPYIGQGPGAQDLGHDVRRPVADEVGRRTARRQDIAASTAADQDLLAGTLGRLQEQHRTGTGGGKNGGHQAGGAGADDHHR